MIPFYQINLGEDSFTGKFGVKILKVSDRVTVIVGDGVEPAEIATRAPAAVRFLDAVKRRCPWACGWADDA